MIDKNGDDITIDGTIKFCEDLEVPLEDVVLLAVAYELKSPGVGEWTRKGWMEGWKSLSCVFFPLHFFSSVVPLPPFLDLTY